MVRRNPVPVLFWLAVFAIAMAYFEAAIVVYLRGLYYPDDITMIFPLAILTPEHLLVELGREACTILMLISIAMAVEHVPTRRFAVFCLLMGVWDLFYYVWLKVLIGWPLTWMEWDVLFLIPWIWLGPWICPAVIAVLFIVWGGRVLASPAEFSFSRRQSIIFVAGTLLGLASFLWPAADVLFSTGIGGLTGFIPQTFDWWLYVPGLLLMGMGFPWRERRVFAR
ncbi:MAG: hypothetical protein Q9M29_10330 [Mariprofundaceae bacterium]|nr:hypothetical protein [Mariprofundaceae bacterium]